MNRRSSSILQYAKRSAGLLTALLALGLFVLSQQQLDLRHSTTYVNGLIDHGLGYYATAKNAGYPSDYTPGLYALLGAALSPVLMVQRLFGFEACSMESSSNCLAESLTLKSSLFLIAVASCWLLEKSIRLSSSQPDPELQRRSQAERSLRQGITLLSMPTVLYSWLIFGAYDGLGAFAAVSGALLYLNRSLFSGYLKVNQHALLACGLTLCTLAVSAKFFPVVILFGMCIGFARSRKDFVTCMLIPISLAVLQTSFVTRLGGVPLRIVYYKLDQDGPTLYNKPFAAALIAACLMTLVIRYKNHTGRASLGFFTTTSILALGFPAVVWHPQWQTYYGVSLYFAITSLIDNKRIKRLFTALLIIQAVAFALSAQIWTNNADITMTLTSIGRNVIPPFQEFALSLGLQPLGIIYFAWKLYSASQIASVVLLLLDLEIARRDKRESKHERTSSSVVSPSGAALIATWLLLTISSLWIVSDWQYRAKALTDEYKQIRVGTERLSTAEPMYILENKTLYRFTLATNPERPERIEMGAIKIGNNARQSKGRIELCLTSGSTDSNLQDQRHRKQVCTSFSLQKARDNTPTWFRFARPSSSRWQYITVSTTLDPGSKPPVLYANTLKIPELNLYGRRLRE
jgi:hypothetical protein